MSWEKVRLGDIAEFSNGINFGKDDYGKGIKIIGVSNFGDKFSPEYDSLTEVKEEVVKSNDYLYPGDIVFVRSNGNKELVGRCMLIDNKADKVTYSVFFASGVFYYFLTEQVRELVQGMADAFPGGVLVFDAANRTAVKMIAKTWLKSAKIKDVGAYFAVSDAKSELSPWDSRLQVSSRGYMLGYNDLKDPSVSGFFRFLARIGDGGMKMQIVKIGFGDRQ